MLYTKDKDLIKISFNSFGELVETAVKGESLVPEMSRSSRTQGNKQFYGTDSFQDAVELATFGWPDGFRQIREFTKRYEDIFAQYFPRQDLSQEIKFDLSGEMVDIGRAVSGEPENMIQFHKSEDSLLTHGNKIQRIYVITSYHCGISTPTVFTYGALTTALIHSMELHGFKTELISRQCVRGDNHDINLIIDCTIKKLSDPLDIDQIGFVFAHAGFLRRIGFSIFEQVKTLPDLQKLGVYPNNGYGYPINYWKDIKEEENNLCFSKIDDNYDLNKFLEIFCAEIKVKLINPSLD